jgi:hypothetical protein
MIDESDCGVIGEMKIGRGNRSTRRKPAPAPFRYEVNKTKEFNGVLKSK